MGDEFDDLECTDLTASEWGESFDDADSESWEGFYDVSQEREEEDEIDDYDAQKQYEEQQHRKYFEDMARKSREQDIAEHYKLSTSRRREILRWIYQSSFCKDFNQNNGFFLSVGNIVNFNDGRTLEMSNWLNEEGIIHGKNICGYSVSRKIKTDKYPERMYFFKLKKEFIKDVSAFHYLVENDKSEYKFFKEEILSVEPIYCKEYSLPDLSTNRQKLILNRLIASKHKKIIYGGNSFWVKGSEVLRLKDTGLKVEIFDWLIQEGFGSLSRVLNYIVKVLDIERHENRRFLFVEIKK